MEESAEVIVEVGTVGIKISDDGRWGDPGVRSGAGDSGSGVEVDIGGTLGCVTDGSGKIVDRGGTIGRVSGGGSTTREVVGGGRAVRVRVAGGGVSVPWRRTIVTSAASSNVGIISLREQLCPNDTNQMGQPSSRCKMTKD